MNEITKQNIGKNFSFVINEKRTTKRGVLRWNHEFEDFMFEYDGGTKKIFLIFTSEWELLDNKDVIHVDRSRNSAGK